MTLAEFVENIDMNISFNSMISRQINPEIKTTLLFIAEQDATGKEKISLKSYDWDKDAVTDYHK